MEKNVKICDSCDTKIATDKCEICSCDLCSSCTVGFELKKPDTGFIRCLQITFEKPLDGSKPLIPICGKCGEKIQKIIVANPENIKKIEGRLFKEIKEYLVENGI